MHVDVELTPSQMERLQAIAPEHWFTRVTFRNASTPVHPSAGKLLDRNNALKVQMVSKWIDQLSPDARVLDAFCANGAFSFAAREAGARFVLGVDLDPGRIAAAQLVAELADVQDVEFRPGDIYSLDATLGDAPPFDVTLALGGLYHVADPAYILRKLRAATSRWLVLQTTSVLPLPYNAARFVVRGDRTSEGLASIKGGSGVWHYSPKCVRELLRHGGFHIVEEVRPPWPSRRQFPWMCVLAECM